MKNKKANLGMRRVLVTLIVYLSVILASLLLGVTHQIAGWVAQTAIALSLGRLIWLYAWGCARNYCRWRV